MQSFILVDVQIERLLPLKLIFDTGAEHTILFDRQVTDLFENIYQREIRVIGSDLQTELPALLSVPVSLSFGKAFQYQTPLIILQENNTSISRIIGENVHGILSASNFSNYLIQIDYSGKWIYLHPRSQKIPDAFHEVDLNMYKNKPYLETEIALANGTRQSVQLLIDTGASLSLLLYRDSTDRFAIPKALVPAYLGSGLGGLLTGYVGKIDALRVGTYELREVVSHYMMVETPLAKAEKQVKNGLIGNLVLERFHLYLDYLHSKLYLKPSRKFDEEMPYDKSGMLVICGGADLQHYMVGFVVPGSPAFEAGIRESDEILRVNGMPASMLNLGKLNALLQKRDGKKIRLVMRRNNSKYKCSFLLRSMI
ncbi:MAG: aspartyl protease family protein [Saprospiraceae bacterium]|nr:aspartyl protease family protein [Saprospiraceae bacterium]